MKDNIVKRGGEWGLVRLINVNIEQLRRPSELTRRLEGQRLCTCDKVSGGRAAGSGAEKILLTGYWVP